MTHKPTPVSALLSALNSAMLETNELDKYIEDLDKHYQQELADRHAKILLLEAKIKALESRRPIGYLCNSLQQHTKYSLQRINRFFDWAGFW